MTKDERELFDEKIKGLSTLINARFTNVDEKLEDIHKEQLRTNGNVKRHEEQINQALVERAQNREEQRHYIGEICECKNKLIHIENKLEDLNFMMRHPKIFIAGLVLMVILTLGTFISSNPLQVFTPQPTQTEQLK